MKQYIDKAAIVAEIDALQDATMENGHFLSSYYEGMFDGLSKIENFLNTIETKEVDLEKETTYYLLYEHLSPLNEIMHKADIKAEMQYHKDIENAFKAGFELGLKSKGE